MLGKSTDRTLSVRFPRADYAALTKASQRFQMSKGAILRLTLRDWLTSADDSLLQTAETQNA